MSERTAIDIIRERERARHADCRDCHPDLPAVKTYSIANCANGCAFSTTVATACDMCDGPLTAPQTVTREQAIAIIRNDDAYQQGKQAVIDYLNGARK